jgi:hypothetical protein
MSRKERQDRKGKPKPELSAFDFDSPLRSWRSLREMPLIFRPYLGPYQRGAQRSSPFGFDFPLRLGGFARKRGKSPQDEAFST